MAMADYLITKEADYISEELAIVPQKTLNDTADKIQNVYESDNGSVNVVSFSNDNFFSIKLQWDLLTLEETEFIQSLWLSANKANGRERTFYWVHPSDGYTYTVRFMSPLSRVQEGNISSFRAISSITLRVEGVKP